MNYFDLLPIVADRGWHETPYGMIRDRDGRCPLCALAHEISGGEIDRYQMAWTALRELGAYNYPAADIVMAAADKASDLNRQRLIRALS